MENENKSKQEDRLQRLKDLCPKDCFKWTPLLLVALHDDEPIDLEDLVGKELKVVCVIIPNDPVNG
jgi:hypothetical protein